MKTPRETANGEATPEQLLQILNAQLQTHRSQRGSPSRKRAMILVVGLLFIIAAAGAALLVLDQMLADFRHRGPAAPAAGEEVRGNF